MDTNTRKETTLNVKEAKAENEFTPDSGETKDLGKAVESAERSKGRTAALLISKIAILTAISYILYLFVKFPLPIFPSFLEIQISDLPALIGGFALGPWCGCLIIILKCLLKMPFTGSACVGELGDIILGIAFVLPAALIYKYHKTKKGALLGLGVGVLASTVVAIVVNWLILIPFYVQAWCNGSWQTLVNMVAYIYPSATIDTFYVFYLFAGVLPFNLLRCLLCAAVTFAIYKQTSKLLHF